MGTSKREIGNDNTNTWEDEVVESHEARLPPAELEKIQKWLKPTDYHAESSEFHRHLLSRTPGTGSWLWETEPYRRWRQSPHHGGLWIKGVPGAGKSVLAASLVDHLRATEDADTPILFFFFRHIILANRHPKSLMRDWLAQLLPHSIALQGALHPMVKAGKIDSISDNVLWDCVLKGLEDVPQAFCVADALDEMETTGSASFFQRLNRLATFSPAKVKLFMTSRPRQDLQSCLSATSTIHISLEEEKVGREIEVFIKHRLSESTSLSEADQENLSKAVASRSRGLFLYARLLIDQVLPELKDRGADIDIKSLPLHLEDMYNEMLARQAKEVGVNTKVQVAILGLITHATRPLRLRELAGFLEQEHQTGTLDKSKNIARFACHPLVQILDDETVQVIHHSFTEYLLDASRSTVSAGAGKRAPQFPVLDPVRVHRDLAVACMKIVAPTIGSSRRGDSEDFTISLPFLGYARSNILPHASHQADIVDEELFDAIATLCEAYRANDGINYETPLHFAARAGLSALAHRIVNTDPLPQAVWPEIVLAGSDDASRGGEGEAGHLEWTPFGVACREGHFEIMQLIWTTHPSEILGSFIPNRMLEETLAHGYSRELQSLLDMDLHIDQREFEYEYYARPKILDLLRDTTVDCLKLLLPQIPESALPELFCDYALAGYPKMMEVLMAEKGAIATWKTKNGTAIYQVCVADKKTFEHVDCLKMLLSSVPDINSCHTIVTYGKPREAQPQPQQGRTILHGLVANWYDGNHEISVEMFDMLIKAGVNLEARDDMGDTPSLCLFPRSFNKSVRKPLRYLLEAGADVHAKDNTGAALIHRAVIHHIDITLIETLLDHGADINALWQQYSRDPPKPALAFFWDDTDWSVFDPFDEGKGREIVAMNTRAELAAFMVKNGATIDAGGDSASVLESALQCCDIDTFKLLMTARSEGSSIDKAMFSFGSHFDDESMRRKSSGKKNKKAPREPLPFIKLLISAGVSTEVRNERGGTPLMKAVNNKAVFDAFLRVGADVNATDNRGRGMLYSLVQGYWSSSSSSRLDRLRDLVKMGCNPLMADEDDISLLHLAVTYHSWYEKNIDFVQQLVDYGSSPRAKTRTGLTPLHMLFHPKHQPSGRRDHPGQYLQDLLSVLEKADGGVDLNAKDEEDLTPLHMAAMMCGNDSCFEYFYTLLENGADPECLSQGGRNVLHLAARARNPAVVGYLADRVPKLIHCRDVHGRTPIFDACMSGIIESVSSLIRAGADVSVHDNQGWTPLHACAEFEEEQRLWTRNEVAMNADEEMKFDRYRPYKLPYTASYSAARSGKVKFTPYLKLRDRGKVGGDSHTIENTELAIFSVVDQLLAAGADPSVKGGPKSSTPAERASQLGCQGMSVAMGRQMKPSKQEQISDPTASKLASLEQSEKEAVLRDPWQFVSEFSLTDISWLRQQDANFFCTLGMEEEPNSDFEKPFLRIHSFIETVALAGLTEVMAQLGDLACRDEDPDSAPIDHWTVDMISGNAQCQIPPGKKYSYGQTFWKPDDIKTVGGYLHPTDWEVHSLLHVACLRAEPNMEMVRVLIEVCGVNVTGPTTRYQASFEDEPDESYAAVLQHLAKTQRFWHLEAIRYLVSKGADINARNKKGKTALHYACASSQILSLHFIELLLGLGADPRIKDDNDISPIDLAASPQKLQILGKYGVDISKSMNDSLWLGIGELNIELVEMALDSGIDINRKEDSPIYTRKELEWEIHSTALYAGHLAVPLAGVFLYSDYTQTEQSSTGEDLRAAIIRLLLDRGADLFQPYWIRKSERNQEGEQEEVMIEESPLLHYLFRKISCEKKYLEILLEYGDKLDFNTRDAQGHTVFLAACASSLQWTSFRAFDLEYSPTSDDVVDYEAEKIWDSGGLFLKMLDHGADIAAVNNDGDNALVSRQC